jgi:hypothetical protein
MINKIIKKLFLVFLIFMNVFFVVKVNWSDDFAKDTFTVKVGDIIWNIWHTKVGWGTLEQKTDNLLIMVIEILMVAIWVIALFVVSVWAWYMIIYNWNEEFLKKWRNMIFTGFLALFIALSSYYLMNLVRYILYN